MISSCYFSVFTAVKKDAKFLTRYVIEVQFFNRKYRTKIGTFSVKKKKVYKREKGVGSLGGALPGVYSRVIPCV